MAVGHALGGLLVVALHTLGKLLDERVGHLGKTALGGAVCDVAGSSAALHPRAHRVKDVSLNPLLLVHELDGLLRAQQDTDEVYLDNCLDDVGGELSERPAAAVDARVVNPVPHCTKVFLGKLSKLLHAVRLAHVALGAIHGRTIGYALPNRGHGCVRVLDVTDHDRVAPLRELDRVCPAHSRSATRDHHAGLVRARHHAESAHPREGDWARGGADSATRQARRGTDCSACSDHEGREHRGQMTAE
mmetsp:Transcript_16759/g.45141  ORF Transcript_16759/g.45141 Transcript_16759/m.45141 type:complete len:246 (-) Transcript_16759:10-747(-)